MEVRNKLSDWDVKRADETKFREQQVRNLEHQYTHHHRLLPQQHSLYLIQVAVSTAY